MTTSKSPLRILKAQADSIAATLKAAERGEAVEVRFAEKVKTARNKDKFKIGIFMDDKIVTIELPWAKIRGTSEVALAEYILTLMREARDSVH